MTDTVIIIGALLLDVVGRYRDSKPDLGDQPGSATVRLGGVALNVAISLKKLGHEVELHTSMVVGSPISHIICHLAELAGVRVTSVIPTDTAIDPVYMSISGDDRSESIVTSSPIEGANFASNNIFVDRLGLAKMVICDTNLTRDQIRYISRICSHEKVPMSVICASQYKAQRLASSYDGSETPYELVSLNDEEFGYLKARASGHGRAFTTPQALVNSRRVLVTSGAKGATLFDGEESYFIPPPSIGEAPSTLGAGDALFASVCSMILRGKTISNTQELDRIHLTILDAISARNI